MVRIARTARLGTSLGRRLGWCGLPLLLGAAAAILFLLAASGPVRAVAAADFNFPGCAPTLQQCLDTLPAGSTVVVQPGNYYVNLTLTTTVSLTGVNSATVILHAVGAQRVLTITGAAVDASVVISGLTFTGGQALSGVCACGGAIYLTGTAHPTLKNLIFINNIALDGGGALVDQAASDITGSRFENNSCTASNCPGGAVVMIGSGAFTIADSQFLSNTAAGNGGAVYAFGGGTILDSFFLNNSCYGTSCGAGAVLVGGSLTVDHSQFIANRAQAGVGAASGNLAVQVTDSLFQDNHCLKTACVAGAFASVGNLTIVNSQVLSNTSQGDGGGAYTQLAMIVSDSLFQNNACLDAGCHAGALYAGNESPGVNSLSQSQFVANRAQGDGGALYVGDRLAITGSLFLVNQCLEVSSGGGGLAGFGALTITDTQFLSNTSGAFGGGLEASVAAAITNSRFQGNQSETGAGVFADSAIGITGTTFLNNAASVAGGALSHLTGNAWLVNNLFVGNTAGGAAYGQALRLNSPGSVIVLHSTFVGGPGPAIEILSGTVGVTNSIVASYTVGLTVTDGLARESHNLFFANGANLAGPVTVDGGSLTGNPLFRQPAAGDYHLQRLSPAVDSGLASGVLRDVDGDLRPQGLAVDMGFDEYRNLAPVATGAAYSTAPNTALVVPAPGLLATGSDANAEPLTALLVAPPLSGTLVLAATGAFTYTPPLDFSGLITWTYALTDGLASSGPALVTITVQPHRLYLPLVVR